MIKTFNYTGKNSIYKLETYLNKRRSSKSVNTSIVNKIIRDVKRNKNNAVLKYEKKFSQNNQLQPSKEKINKAEQKAKIEKEKAEKERLKAEKEKEKMIITAKKLLSAGLDINFISETTGFSLSKLKKFNK